MQDVTEVADYRSWQPLKAAGKNTGKYVFLAHEPAFLTRLFRAPTEKKDVDSGFVRIS